MSASWWIQIIRIPKLSDPESFDERPYTPCREPVQSDTRPGLDYWGPYHCSGCTISCASFGATERQAYERNHRSEPGYVSPYGCEGCRKGEEK